MNILFVCSGNTCRSPMAQGYLNSKNIRDVSALSAGFLCEGDTVSKNAVTVMKEIGVDISEHTSRLLSPRLLLADRIFCMGESHKSALIAAGINADKISVLGGGIPDPYGGDLEAYRACRDEITKAIDGALYGGEVLPLVVLPADKTDIPAIAELEKECFNCPWSQTAISEAMEHNTVFFKAVYGDKTVGYISITAVSGEGYINNIAVKKEYRGKSIGSLLLDRAVTFCVSRRLEFLSLEVRKSNEAAIALYKKARFIKDGVRKDFYDTPKEDGIIMTRRF